MNKIGPANKRKGSKKGKAPAPPKKTFGSTIGYAENAKTKIGTNGKASKK
jgi:hypothetical protein